VAGGADQLNMHLQRTLHAEGLLAVSPDSLPHAAGAGGAIGSEGACLLAIEPAAAAAERGAAALGRLEAGVECFTRPGEAGDRRRVDSMAVLFDRAGFDRDSVDLLVLSGNGDKVRDGDEARLVGALFGDRPPPAILPKAVIGESWGASAPIGLVAGLEAMRTSRIPAVPPGLEPAAASAGLNLPRETIEAPVRQMVILDCSETGQFSSLAVTGPGEER
jgi:act minimal PKS chain-length factor (CLF/KS beta)